MPRLVEWGYTEERQGVFRSRLPLLWRVRLLVLNDLPSQPHNAYVKLFASRERDAAFAALDAPVIAESSRLQVYMVGLQRALDVKGEIEMAEALTPEKVMEIGERVRQRILEMATPEERLMGLEPEERLAGLEPEERLAGMSAAERRTLLRLLQEDVDTVAGDEANRNGDAT